MKPLHHADRATHTRGPLPRTAMLLAALLTLGACGGEPDVEPRPKGPSEPRTSPYTLEAGVPDPEMEQDGRAFRGVLTDTSHSGTPDFRYDAFIVTARKSGWVTMRSDVVAVHPDGYAHGYGYPLTIAPIEEGVTLGQSGGNYVQNALETGTAILMYPVAADQQYVLVYKTFRQFTPLTYRLTLPPELKLEGRIHAPPTPVPVPEHSEGAITLDNPRPEALHTFMNELRERVSTD